MLAKQLWNIAQNPDSIVYRILKAKYFPKTDILAASVGYRPSYVWRSLMSAKELVEEGAAWRVGNGKQVQIGADRWIGVDNPTIPMSLTNRALMEKCVDVLIDERQGRWKRELILNSFDVEEAEKILSMPLSSSLPKDRRVWRCTKNGAFTVKSAYHLAVEKFSRMHDNRPSASTVPKEWKKMWELKVIPRIKVFVWKACKNAIPTKGNLCRRGSDIDPICRLCGETVETIDHILLQCPVVQQIWSRSVLRIDRKITQEGTFKDLMWSYLHNRTIDIASLVATTAWEIWKSRNSLYFENIEFSVKNVMDKSHERWVEYLESNERNKVVMQRERYVETWKKPRRGEYKLNCDVAVLQNGLLGFGFVLRDEYDRVKLAGKKEGFAKGSSTLMEGMAMRYALQMVNQYGMTATNMESDSRTLIDSINGKVVPEIYLEILIQDIRQLAMVAHCESFTFIPKQANQTAHYAAKGIEFISINHSPSHLSEYVNSDSVA